MKSTKYSTEIITENAEKVFKSPEKKNYNHSPKISTPNKEVFYASLCFQDLLICPIKPYNLSHMV